MKRTFKTALLLGVVFASGVTVAAGNDLAKRSLAERAEASRAEKAQQRQAPRRAAVVPTATATYSGTTVGTPTYNRTVESCAALSAVGSDVNYSTKAFTVDTAGAYDITSVQDGDYDGMIFLYTGTFDPSDATTNCTAGSDDGAGGIGTSEILGVALATGTNYTIVTASYDNGATGTFTNTISGPGNISIPNIALVKTTPGVLVNGNFNYVLNLSNPGSTNETITVTDTLPAGLTYVSNTCGGTFAAGTFTWNAGLINSGGSASCTLTVNNPATSCSAITNTATATSVSGLTASSTTSNLDDAVPDPSLEATGAGGTDWASSSTNFGTVLCDASCANDPSFGPADGSFWAWFAGANPASTTQTFPEVGTLSQSITIPTGATQLTFKFWAPACGTVAADFIALRIDNTEVWRFDGTNANCGATGYSDESVNITAYANGAAHTVEFYSEQSNTGTGVTNFFVDLISIPQYTCTQSDSIFANGFEP